MKKKGIGIMMLCCMLAVVLSLAPPPGRAADTGKTYTLTSMNTLNENGEFRSNGWTKPQYQAGQTVTLTANYDRSEAKFQEWEIPEGLTLIEGDKHTEKITFIMPERDITLNAISEYIVPLYSFRIQNNINGMGHGGRIPAGHTMTAEPHQLEELVSEGYKFWGWDNPEDLTVTEGDEKAKKIVFVMPDRDITLKSLFIRFDDVLPGVYCFDAVLWAVEKGVTNGTTDATFSPGNTCTTANIITFLWRANGSPAPSGANPFSDVPSGSYYEKAAVWAYEKGLVSGKSFNGSSDCTRAATMKYLWILAGRPTSRQPPFADVAPDADYAQAISWAVAKGVTNGTSETTFSPDNACTRGQIATFLYRHYAQ